MSARSRERWRRLALVGQLSAAYQILRGAQGAKHLTAATRAEADRLAYDTYRLLERVRAETTEPAELSAKKGT